MRLTARLFLLISSLLVVTVGTAVLVTLFLSARIGRQAITDRLAQGELLRQTEQEDLYDRLTLSANLFVADANLIAYVAEAQTRVDSASILDLLLDRQADLGFDFAVVTDPDGYLLARSDQLTSPETDLATLQPLMALALDDFQSAGLWREGDELYHAVIVPLVQGGIDLVGFFAMAFSIDDLTALESRRLDGSEVAYVLLDPPTLVGSSFNDNLAPALAPIILELSATGGAGPAARISEVRADGERWLVGKTLLADADGNDIAARYTAASLRQETAPFRRIGRALGLVGLGSLLLALLATYLLARRLTQPLSRLVAAAAKARGGEYEAELPVDRQDELGELGREFRDLLSELREKRDMEAYVATLSRNLPEPVVATETSTKPARRAAVTLLAAEFRQYATALTGDPQVDLERLQHDLQRAARLVGHSQGSVSAFAGHRLLAFFEGPSHAVRALKVAIDLIIESNDPEQRPAVALATGETNVGTIEWQSRTHGALSGRSVQIIETLLREATAGEVLLPVSTREVLFSDSSMPDLVLTERQGLTTALRYCAVDVASAPSLATLTLDGSQLRREAGPVFSPGQVVAERFEILALAGRGGMGAVYKARDRKLGDVVALKTLRDNAWHQSERIEALKQEIKLARKITHPLVLRVFDLGEFEGVPFISMEYVRGVTLRQLMSRSSRLPFSAALRLARQICQGLEAVHGAGILHHDMKPENVLLEPTGNARLMDFGIARPVTGDLEAGKKSLGTPFYLAPEQVRGQTADARADIFATGLLLFELFTGGKPFRDGKNIAEVLKIKVEETPLAATEIWPETPSELTQLLARCLEKDPADRFQSVTELLAALDRLSI